METAESSGNGRIYLRVHTASQLKNTKLKSLIEHYGVRRLLGERIILPFVMTNTV
jgi:hypothetical protein